MKNKLITVCLSLTLILTLSFSVVADTSVDVQTLDETNQISVIDGVTVKVDEDGAEIISNNETISQSVSSNNGISYSATAPTGFLDVVSKTQIGGWAYQSNIPNTALDVHIYINNNSTGESKLIVTTANGYRSDLAAAGYGNGYHAFSYNINWKSYKPGTYSVYAYAIGVNIGNRLLNNAPKSFTVRSMQGVVDSLHSTGVRGWAWKPDAPNESVGVHVHIVNLSGEVLDIIMTNASIYRSDLEAAGYGNGKHGFSASIDWDEYPEERLRVMVYMYDGSGVSPVLYDVYYDNRKPIYLMGMVDSDGYDHSTWTRLPEVDTYCENIGCSSLVKRSFADNNYYTFPDAIHNSSYCAISTHGDKLGIQWSMKNIVYDEMDWFGFCSTDTIAQLPPNYFSGTRCVVIMACETAKGGESDSENFVNSLKRKGVKTVVGFEDIIQIWVNTATLEVYTDRASQCWIKEFTKQLGYGETVSVAASKAYTASIDTLNNITFGLESVCIVGEKNQIVKH